MAMCSTRRLGSLIHRQICCSASIVCRGAVGSAAADWLAGRKFNPYQAAFWCSAGLTLGFGAPAIAAALGYGAPAGYGAGAAAFGSIAAATRAASGGIDPNKLHHIFDKPLHNLDRLLQAFGSQQAAYNAVQRAAQDYITAHGLTGKFEIVINVGGVTVTVRGMVVNGIVRIGTFFVPGSGGFGAQRVH
jgi:hypothetical protein